jgi:hypothetical protein
MSCQVPFCHHVPVSFVMSWFRVFETMWGWVSLAAFPGLSSHHPEWLLTDKSHGLNKGQPVLVLCEGWGIVQ